MNRFIISGCLLILLISGCKKPDIRLNNPNDSQRPAAEFLRNNYAYSLFYAAIAKAGLTQELNGAGPFTIWAPSDAAFNRIGIRRPSDFDRMTPENLRRLVLLHVQYGSLKLEDIPLGTINNRYANAGGTDLWLGRIDTRLLSDPQARIGTFVNGMQTGIDNRYNIRLSNGIFHEISEVLKYEDSSVREWLEKQGRYKVLIAGFKKFGYWDVLRDDKKWTIMAPTDSIFNLKGLTVESVSRMDTTVYRKRLFGAYIFQERFFTSDLSLFNYGLFLPGSFTTIELGIYNPIKGDEKFSNGIRMYPESSFFVNKTFILENNWEMNYRVPFFNSSRSNNLTRNGTIHHLNGIVLLPDEAVD